MTRSYVLGLLLLASGACRQEGNPATRSGPSPLPSGIAARFGTQTISVAELDEKVAADIFELRSTVLRLVLVEKLVAEEARRRNVAGLELRRLEVEEKVPEPSEEEGARALQEWIDAGKITPTEASATTPAHAAKRLRTIRVRAREEAYYDELIRKANVQIDFRALGKPHLEITEDGPILGTPDAAIKIIEFADLSKTFTTAWQPTLEKLLTKYAKDVSFLFKQKPGEAGSPSAKLAEAALCAHDQGRYWDYRRALLARSESSRVGERRAVAQEAKLDLAAFDGCLASGKTLSVLAREQGEVLANRLNEGDPVVSINGIIVAGAQSFETVDRLLRIEMTGTP